MKYWHPETIPAECLNGSPCILCKKYQDSPEFKATADSIVLVGGKPSRNPKKAIKPPSVTLPCRFRTVPTGESVDCKTCTGSVRLKLTGCEKFGDCTLVKKVDEHACCKGCTAREEPIKLTIPAFPQKVVVREEPEMQLGPIKWAYGLTTVPERRDNLLPRTLASLKLAGFENPTLFVDGWEYPESYRNEFHLETVCRYPRIKAYGNWILSLAELYIRNPTADRFAMFQDDFVTYRNLRQYLEKVPYIKRGYQNLYTFPVNLKIAEKNGRRIGWFASDQLGKGAVALVFDKESVIELLGSMSIIKKPLAAKENIATARIDGGVVEALCRRGLGWAEYAHNPSLVQHLGLKSSIGIGNNNQAQADSFRGENFDALELLEKREMANT